MTYHHIMTWNYMTYDIKFRHVKAALVYSASKQERTTFKFFTLHSKALLSFYLHK